MDSNQHSPICKHHQLSRDGRCREGLAGCKNVSAFNMDDMAKEVASPRTSNMVLLGAAAPMLKIEIDKIEDGIRTVFGAKGENIVEMNIKAFRAGLEYTQNIIKNK